MFRGPGHFMGAELEGEIPSYAEHDDFLVKVPALKELLCRGGFRHRWPLAHKASFSSLHQNHITEGSSFTCIEPGVLIEKLVAVTTAYFDRLAI